VLLKKNHSTDILTKLHYYERKLNISKDKQLNKRALEMAALTRMYFEMAFALPYEFRESELIKKMNAKKPKLNKILKDILSDFFKSVNAFEFNKKVTSIEELHLLLEELFQLVYTTSEPNIKKYKESKEKRIKSTGYKNLFIKLANVEIALQYGEIEIAKNKFLKVLQEYGNLHEKHKNVVYDQMHRINNEIKYFQGMVQDKE